MVLRCANVFRIALVISVLVILFAGFASAADKIELRGEVYDGISSPNVVGGYDPLGNPVNLSWNAINFAGFAEDMKFGITGSERLLISQPLSDFNRFIPEQRLWYISDRILRNFTVYDQKGLTVAGNANYSVFNFLVGHRVVAIKHNSSKLAPVVLEQNISEKKALYNGSVWDMGDGYSLIAQGITNTSARLVLSRNGVELDNKTASKNTTYVSLQNIANETNVPIFVTYIDSIFTGNETRVVFLKYTWLISTSVDEIKAGDIEPGYKVFEVWSIDSNRITLTNQLGLTLARDTAITLFGPPPPSTEGFKLKVADSDSLRFYPVIEITTPGIYEVRGKISENGSTKTWDALNFAGFWYDFKDNLRTEILVLSQPLIGTRTIPENSLWYNSTKAAKTLKVIENGKASATDADFNKFDNGRYYIVGWQGEKYVAVKGKAKKLTKLIIEQGNATSEKKTLTVGETWDIGDGWTLQAQSIDAKASPRQVWLVLSKDGIKKDDKVLAQGQAYAYIEKSFAGETDVPLFVTYIDSIFAGANTDMVQLRYTWAISTSVTEIKVAEKFGNLEVMTASADEIKLNNKDMALTLSTGATVDIMGDLKFRVADNASVLRFYPFVTYEIFPPPPPPQPFDTLRFEPNTWNLVSVPKMLINSSVDIAFKNLSYDGNNVKWLYDTWTTNVSFWRHPNNILPLDGYWVYNNASSVVFQKLNFKSMAGPNVPPSMLLKAGWNLIGHTSTQAMPVSSALISIDGKYSHLLTYSPAEGWKMYIVGNPAFQQFNTFEPGRGYWLFMTQDATYAAVDT